MPVPAALEFGDFVPAGMAAGQAHRRHRRLGPRTHHPHHFNGGHHLHNALGQCDFQLGRSTKTGPLGAGFLYGLYDAGMGMAENERPPRAHVVDVFAAVDIKNPRTSPPVDKARTAAHCAESARRTVHASGDDVLRLGEGPS